MLRVRVSGPTYELKDYLEHMEKDKVYQVMSQSKVLKNKGTNKIFRVFSDVDKRTRMESLITFQKSSSTSRFSDSFIQKFLLFERNFQNILTLLYCVLVCQNITDKMKKNYFFLPIGITSPYLQASY